MLGTLIILLQEESERICGTALPEEMCRKILIEQGGMQSPTAAVWKKAKVRRGPRETMWGLSYALLRRPDSADHLAVVSEITERVLADACLPDWVAVAVKNTKPYWPYKSRRAMLANVLRGDDGVRAYNATSTEDWPVYYRQVIL